MKIKSETQLFLRFIGAVFVPSFFLCIAISFGILNIYKQYSFTQKEIVGTQAVHLLFEVFTDLQKIRGFSNILLWNNTPDIAAQRQEVMKNFKKLLEDPKSKKLFQEFGLESEMNAILLEAHSLYKVKGGAGSKDEIFENYTALIEKISSAILLVGDRSNLILDPEIDTYYLMEIVIRQVPDLCEGFGVLRGIGSGIIARGEITAEESILFRNKVLIMREQLKKFVRAQSIIREATTGSQVSLPKVVIDQPASVFLQSCESLEENKSQLSAKDFFQRGTDVIDVLSEAFHSTDESLQDRLKKRLTGFLQLLILTVLLSVATIVAIFYFSLSFYRLQQTSYRELEQISITDPLTSIPNRRYLDMVFDGEIQRARRDGKGVAFGLMDIDFFKRFNDTYGHQEGDLVLQKVAGALKSSLQRVGDYYFRFGGEEFCFLFNAPSLVDVKTTGERIRASVERLEIEHSGNSAGFFVTISIGVAFLPKATTENLDYMIKQADDLLYEAKDNGRNQCVAKVLSPSQTPINAEQNA